MDQDLCNDISMDIYGMITQDFKVFLRLHRESIVEPYSPLQVAIRHSRIMIKDDKTQVRRKVGLSQGINKIWKKLQTACT